MARIKTDDKGIRYVEKISRIDEFCEAFLQSRKASGFSPNTVIFYRKKLSAICPWFIERRYDTFDKLTPECIRQYLNWLSDQGHNKGGVHTFYRTLKTYLNWVWDEYDYSFRNPMTKVKMNLPRPQPLEGISIDEVRKMLDAVKWNQFPQRDKAMISILVDVGLRRSELMNLTFGDVDIATGRIVVRHGKGDKFRIVFAGKECRKNIRQYVNCLEDIKPTDPFWLTKDGDVLSADGALSMLRRTEKNAGLDKLHCFHDFRRCCAIERFRNGDDIFTVSRLLGHADIEVTKRYLYITDDDDRDMSYKSSPMDNHRKANY